jgi:hypothetical protein
MYKNFIVSMATIPERFEKLKANIRSILEQEDVEFDKFLIIVNKYESEDVLKQYDEISALSPKIEVVLGDNKWRSCNKVIYPIQHYPHKKFITVDDDIYYYPRAFADLLTEQLIHPGRIISHETNPVSITDTGYIMYHNAIQTKFKQECFDKYMTGCCLFPTNVFEKTDVLNYNKMYELTQGMHDEIWLWVNTTLRGVKSICLNKTLSFEMDGASINNDESLGKVNGDINRIREYNNKINELYNEPLLKLLKANTIKFEVTEENFYGIICLLGNLVAQYKNFGGIEFDLSRLPLSFKKIFSMHADNFKLWIKW